MAGHRSSSDPLEKVGSCSRAPNCSTWELDSLEGSKAQILLMRALSRSFRIFAHLISAMPSSTAMASSTRHTTGGGWRKDRSSAKSRRLMAMAAAATMRSTLDASVDLMACCRIPAGGGFFSGLSEPCRRICFGAPALGDAVFPGRPRTRGCRGSTFRPPCPAAWLKSLLLGRLWSRPDDGCASGSERPGLPPEAWSGAAGPHPLLLSPWWGGDAPMMDAAFAFEREGGHDLCCGAAVSATCRVSMDPLGSSMLPSESNCCCCVRGCAPNRSVGRKGELVRTKLVESSGKSDGSGTLLESPCHSAG
mmetsp:Transcript_35195/g.98866  ORF Transcript_35195/g.98866 Transcript_35195/m.98866 type:complete len:306 (+) Transcript_35195:719-1636(+)